MSSISFLPKFPCSTDHDECLASINSESEFNSVSGLDQIGSLNIIPIPRKNYVRIEKEFIEAKFILHQKLDRKEKLTEHLCFIIEENENRKAKKLQQLMDELNEDASREDYQILPVYDQEEICSSCGGFPESTTDDEAASAATVKPVITRVAQ